MVGGHGHLPPREVLKDFASGPSWEMYGWNFSGGSSLMEHSGTDCHINKKHGEGVGPKVGELPNEQYTDVDVQCTLCILES